MNEKITLIQNHPLHKHVGVQEIISESGNGILKAIVNQNALNPSGFYHGGVMYLLCDVCAYAGILSALDPNEDAVTHDIHLSVLRPANLDDELIYSSKIVRHGRTLCFINVEASCGAKLVATARITKSIIKVDSP